MSWSNENKSCMRVDKQEFTREFHQLSCPGQTRTRVAWELTSESLHESFINSHVLVKREQELHESWQARVYMRVSSTLMSWSNENKSCMRVDKREFTWEFHQLSCPGQTRTRVARELTSESLHESFINSHWCPGQTRTRVAWELTSKSLHESFINSHDLTYLGSQACVLHATVPVGSAAAAQYCKPTSLSSSVRWHVVIFVITPERQSHAERCERNVCGSM